MAEKWIGKAVKHPGAATRKAQAEGLTVHEWAVRHKGDGGQTGRQARFALELEAFRRGRKRAA